mmetsp:Transcript_29315/g.62311  ORF Transcript_29315/g.62311 Transcript_29315/m.62311 type:complete len:201 (-) Transcript_29315:247-849(-)
MASCNLLKRKARSVLPLSAAVALLGTLSTPAFAFRAAPSITLNCAARQAQHVHRRPAITTLNLSSPDPDNNNLMQDMMDRQVMREQQQQDPLIASLTRNDESTPANARTCTVPVFGEITDDTFKVLAPVAAISVLGFIFSIVVAFNSRDSLVHELTKVTLPEMKYTPTVVQAGECRGLCSNQDQDLDGLRNFMESISRKD